MNGFTILFISVLGLGLITRFWLAIRHMDHVAGHRNRVPSAFRTRVPLKDHRKAADYTVARTQFGLASGAIDAGLLLIWTLGGGLAWLDQVWTGAGWGPLATGTALILSLLLISGVLEMPVSWYQTFVIEERFGFNKTTRRLFITDALRQMLLLALIAAPLVLAALWLMHETGRWWWLAVWLMWTAFSLLLIWAYPGFIAPLFNRFSPLKDAVLRKRIHALLKRSGFQSRGVFVMDGSRRSAHGNAYFTGLGRSKRVVFFDTLLDTLAPTEIEAVLAHELGHYTHRHVVKRMLLTFVTSLIALALLGWLAEQHWFYAGLGVEQPSPHMALMLFLLAAPVFSFFFNPLLAWSSRRHEFEADRYAVQQTNARALIGALVKLYKENASTLTPDPLYSAFYDTHPPAPVRIAQLQKA